MKNINFSDNIHVFDKGVVPKWMTKKTISYETITGSHSYGCNTKDSDIDIAGFCVPPKEVLFRSLSGEIPGYNTSKDKFEQFVMQGCKINDEHCDLIIYNIAKFFYLAQNANPNILDILNSTDKCVLKIDKVGQMIRDNRHMFLSKKAYHTFKGYAYAQIHKIKIKKETQGLHKKYIDQYGYDVKYASHVIRLLLEAKCILETGQLIVDQNSKVILDIRNGEYLEKDILKWSEDLLVILDQLYESSNEVPHSPDIVKIKGVLVDCLEESYGNLKGFYLD